MDRIHSARSLRVIIFHLPFSNSYFLLSKQADFLFLTLCADTFQ
jgi:hypothetical protein